MHQLHVFLRNQQSGQLASEDWLRVIPLFPDFLQA